MASYELESNNSTYTATSIAPGVAVKGQLSSGLDKDYFAVVASSAGSISVDLDSTGSYSRRTISIVDASGVTLSSLASSGDGVLGAGIPGAGTYYVLVQDDDDYSGVPTDQYTLKVSGDFETQSAESKPTYAVSALDSTINEGEAAVFKIQTENVPANTDLSFTLSGMSAGRDKDYFAVVASSAVLTSISSGSSFGSMKVDASGKATVSVTTLIDGIYEPTELLQLRLSTGESASVMVKDVTPTYAVTASDTQINEGEAVEFIIQTEIGSANTNLSYTLSGMSSYYDYSGSSFGSVRTDASGKATVSIKTVSDNRIEVPQESLTLKLSTGESASVVVKDVIPTYTVTASNGQIDEGETAVFTIKTENVPTNTNLSYTLSGMSSYSDYSGSSFGSVRTDASGKATVSIKTNTDNRIEIPQESLTLKLSSNESASVVVKDVIPTYTVNASDTQINEGETAVFNIKTENVPANTTVYYSLSGVSSSDIEGSLWNYRSVRIGADGIAIVSIKTVVDTFKENNDIITFRLNEGSSTASIKLADLKPIYTVTPVLKTINEGELAVFTISTKNVQGNTLINYSLSGVTSSDVRGGLTGSVRVNSVGIGTVSIETLEDASLETNETLTLRLSGGESATVQINDSQAFFTVSTDKQSVLEGETAIFNVSKSGVSGANTVGYTLKGVSRADVLGGSLSGTVQIDAEGKGTVSVPIARDALTEGDELLSFVLENGSKQSVTVRDFVKTEAIESVSYENGSHLSEGFGQGLQINYTSNDSTPRLVAFDLFAEDAKRPETSITLQTDSEGKATGLLSLTNDKFPEPDQTYKIQVSGNAQVFQYAQFKDDDEGNPVRGASGNQTLTTSDANDVVDAGTGDDLIVSSLGNDFINGGEGRDALTYESMQSKVISLRKDGDAIVLNAGSKSDRLLSVERLQFDDKWVALDLDGGAGDAAKVIIAAFGSASLEKYLGAGIGLADSGSSMADLANLVINNKDKLMPYSTPAEFVDIMYNNLLGRDANLLESAQYVGFLNQGLYTEAELLVLASQTTYTGAFMLDFAIDNVGLPYESALV